MLNKGFKQYLAEAGASVDSVPVKTALGLIKDDDVIFVDVRDAQERKDGFIPGSVHVARGFLEFIADPEGPMHNPAVSTEKRLVVYCGSGGRSLLAAKTLHDMGFPRVASLAGGIAAWRDAGGDIQT